MNFCFNEPNVGQNQYFDIYSSNVCDILSDTKISTLEVDYECISSPMADVHDEKTRSYNISRIKAKDTKPEVLVRRFLFSNGFRFRLHDKRLPGKPDIVLPKYRAVIFVHGCFWHGHKGCKYFVLPKTRSAWWQAKIEGNAARDTEAQEVLRAENWRVFVIWECELKRNKKEDTLRRLADSLRLV